jgi:DNA-binding LacI/PurR family transcriptional regulator
MPVEKPATMADIAQKTGLKQWKVAIVLGNGYTKNNLNRATDDEIATILHAAAELGYEYLGKGTSGRSGRKKEINLAMVSKRAGVSSATVNTAFYGGKTIAPETKALVLRVAKELGYEPERNKKIDHFYRSKQ